MKAFILFLLLFSINCFAAQKYIVTAGDMSGNITSEAIDVGFYDKIAIQAIYTGAPDGDLKLQVSNKFVSSTGCAGIADADWTDYAGSTVTITTADSTMFNVSNISYKCLRAVYTFSSGTGVLNAILSTKDYL